MTSIRSARRRNVVTSVILSVVAGMTACSADPVVKADKFVASGDRYASNGQLNEAVIEYGRAIQARPELAVAHYKQAQTYLALQDVSKAYGAFSRAASLDAANVDAQIQAGTLLL